MVDIVLNFRTTYMHHTSGEEIVRPGLIAKNYLRSLFVLDFLACLPLDVVMGSASSSSGTTAFFASLDMVKIIRIARMERLIRYMNVK